MASKSLHAHAAAAPEALLRRAGLRATMPRLLILKALAAAAGPQSIDALYARLTKEVDRVTVYRTLHELAKRGVVYQCDFRTGKALFELQSADHHHHHVVCTTCGQVEPVDLCLSHIEQKALAGTRAFATVTSHSLELFGTCRKCNSQ